MSEQPENIGRLYPVAKAVLFPVFRFGWRFDVTGIENIPTDGPAIMAPNHTSVIDSFFLPAVLPRRITYVGKAEYLDDWKTRYLFPAMGMIPIDRKGGSAAKAALDAAASILQSGGLFGIYPEGTRSRSGDLHKGRTGAARLALRTGSPIVPVGLRGTRDVQPPDASYPRPFMTVAVNIGRPVAVSSYQGRADDPRVWREITDRVMYEISQLSGQRYINEYANAPVAAAAEPAASAPITEVPLDQRRSSAEVLQMVS